MAAAALAVIEDPAGEDHGRAEAALSPSLARAMAT